MLRLQARHTFTSGVALSPAFVVGVQKLTAEHTAAIDATAETEKFHAAVEKVQQELTLLAAQNEIFAAHLELVNDPSLVEEICRSITEESKCAQWSLEDVITAYAAEFDRMEDSYFRERAADIRDIGTRLLMALQNTVDKRFSGICSPVILVAKELTPSDTAKLPLEFIRGFLTQEGGVTGHVAIMAKGLGIPALVGVAGLLSAVKNGSMLCMDAATGEIIADPDADTLSRYQALQLAQQEHALLLAMSRNIPAKTADGKAVQLYANIGGCAELGTALQNGADGVGLFRTEFLYMNSTHFPTEEEQFLAYQQAAIHLDGRELIVRTLDIGGDKALPYFTFDTEENPFLGCRAIRFCLAHPEIFKQQLRALLRAAAFGNLKIMYPMLVDLEELRQANHLLAQCKAELANDGLPFRSDTPVGMMIETPASVLLAAQFAEKVDFFSIGTNDLTQYILAADRGNHNLASLYNPLRPAVVAAIAQVIRAAHTAGIPVGMCGEFAGDPRALALLIGLGLDEFSVSPALIPELKLQLQTLTLSRAQEIAKAVLGCDTLEETIALTSL